MNDSGLSQLPDLTDTSGKIIRLAVQITGIVLIGVGVVYLLDVFSRVRAVISDPKGLQALSAGFAEMIEADKIVIPTGGRVAPPPAAAEQPLDPGNAVVPAAAEPIPIGKSIALGMALLWHVLFAWIPLAILAAGGKLISWTLADSRHTREAIMALAQRGGTRDRARPLDLSSK